MRRPGPPRQGGSGRLWRSTRWRGGGELAAVVDHLDGAAPVDAHGVARIRNLLADGTGPLYREPRPGHLREELLGRARAAMESFA